MGAGGHRFESCHLDIRLESLFYRGFFVCKLIYENSISLPSILIETNNENNITFNNLELLMGNNIINIDSQFNGEHILLLTSGYTENDLNFENIIISFEIDTNNNEGDINDDQIINVLDIVLLVDFILSNEYEVIADLNEDGFLNVIDVVVLVNIILN